VTASEDDLYRTVILDHSRNPRGTGVPAGATCRGAADNPFCGDRFTVGAVIDDDVAVAGRAPPRIAAVGFDGTGCAISTAAASMMTAAVKGLTPAQVERLYSRFDQLVAGADASDGDASGEGDAAPPPLGELAAFAGVARFPVRAKCARLPWQALLAALAQPR
jgi:nitrogen fixation protein NifU and related proteins